MYPQNIIGFDDFYNFKIQTGLIDNCIHIAYILFRLDPKLLRVM